MGLREEALLQYNAARKEETEQNYQTLLRLMEPITGLLLVGIERIENPAKTDVFARVDGIMFGLSPLDKTPHLCLFKFCDNCNAPISGTVIVNSMATLGRAILQIERATCGACACG